MGGGLTYGMEILGLIPANRTWQIGKLGEGASVGPSTPKSVLDARVSSAALKEKYGHLNAEQRGARIDDLSTENYNRILADDLSQVNYVYRAIDADLIDIYRTQSNISGRFGSPTYFQLKVGETH